MLSFFIHQDTYQMCNKNPILRPTAGSSPTEELMTASRRGLLRQALLLIGGSAGAVVGGSAFSKKVEASPKGFETLTIYGDDWHIVSRDLMRGDLPAAGARMLTYGGLYERPGNGVRFGDFFSDYVSLHEVGGLGLLASLEQHTFNFGDGSIIGSGTTRPGLDTEDEFAIIGGTGIYAGARGTYVVRQSQTEFGGDGSASITFRFITEATDGPV
jgi:hypothetical protein